MPWSQRTINTPGGAFRVFEAGDGPRTVLYLHDELSSMPGELAERLAGAYRVVSPVHPGFGAAQRPEWVESVRDVVEHYVDLLAELALPPDTVLVGVSLGGWIAAELAIRVGFGPMALVNPTGVRVPGLPAGDLWFVRDPEALLFTDRTAIPDVDYPEQVANAESAARYGWSPRLHDPTLAARMHRIRRPVRLIWGTEDQLLPKEYLAQWLRLLPGADVVEVAEAGHFPGYEQPELTAAAITEFIRANQGSNA